MKQNSMKPNPSSSEAGPEQAGRKLPVVSVAVVTLALVAAAIVYWSGSARRQQPPAEESASQIAETPVVESPVVPEPPVRPPVLPPPPAPAESLATPLPIAKPTSPPQPASAAQTVAPPREPDAFNRQLVTSLAQLDLSSGQVTPEAAAGWRQALQQLGQQGAAAVPAIREFLERNQDLAFESVPGGQQLGYPSLRLALLDALQNAGGPEAIDLSSRTLQTATDPREIAFLAQYLEKQAPGQYQQTALNAARESLSLAAGGRLEGKDVGPLFGVLQQFGGPEAAPELERVSGSWKYYSAISLANLPDGAGLPTLMQWAQGQDGASKSTQLAALQMLAQVATQYPQAQEALLQQARANQIPTATWLELATVLGGHTYQIGHANIDPATADLNIKKYHLSFGNQNFYSTQNAAGFTPDQINQRVTLIDQMLAATASNPIALQALQRSKEQLLTRLPTQQ